ncbi:hypothetical protein K0M31_016864 [Melipona bicolor]|uniref:Uncharacterized protein n=1 Tax=Melipona bicolor TaxID=60889 RepID=A0AA40KEJ2_9HYME|nr:hypothetical protein K0M31_016864 [Melipona bicolor]
MKWSALKPGEKMGKLNEIIKAAGRMRMIRKRKAKPRQAWFDKNCEDKKKEVWKELKTYLKSKKEEDRLKLVSKRKKLNELYRKRRCKSRKKSRKK